MSNINKCPECGASNIRKARKLGTSMIIFMLFFICISMGLAFPVAVILYFILPIEYTCNACGNKWK